MKCICKHSFLNIKYCQLFSTKKHGRNNGRTKIHNHKQWKKKNTQPHMFSSKKKVKTEQHYWFTYYFTFHLKTKQ